jgi:hypothetical protein
MSRKKSAEQKLVEAVKELGLVKAASIFKVLEEYNAETRPKLGRPFKVDEKMKETG